MRASELRPINVSPSAIVAPHDGAVLKLKQKGCALIYDVAEFDEATVHVRGALPTTDFATSVVHIRQSNFEGDKEGLDFDSALSLSATGGIKKATTASRFLIVVVTTAGTGAADEEAEVAVLARVRDN